jgi:hypothetical protein
VVTMNELKRVGDPHAQRRSFCQIVGPLCPTSTLEKKKGLWSELVCVGIARGTEIAHTAEFFLKFL